MFVRAQQKNIVLEPPRIKESGLFTRCRVGKTTRDSYITPDTGFVRVVFDGRGARLGRRLHCNCNMLGHLVIILESDLPIIYKVDDGSDET